MPEPDYRQQQEQDEERLTYTLDLIDRIRAHTTTDEDIAFLFRELTPYSSNTRTRAMPKITEMLTSKYLRKEDVDPPMLVTFVRLTKQNVATESQPPEMKWCMHFRELDKPLVLNKVNIQLGAAILESDDTDKWKGKRLVLYNDPTIMYQGKLTGGIRIRAAQGETPQPVRSGIAANPIEAGNRAAQEIANDNDNAMF